MSDRPLAIARIHPLAPFVTLHTTLVTCAWWLARVLYFQPLFRARCASAGAAMNVYLGLPFVQEGLRLHVGRGLKLNARSRFERRGPGGVAIVGDDCAIGYEVTLAVGSKLIIGDRVRLADHVVLGDGRASGTLLIGDDVWVGTAAHIGDGLTIGDGAIIAAGAVVLENVPPRTVMAGSPARPLRTLPTGLR